MEVYRLGSSDLLFNLLLVLLVWDASGDRTSERELAGRLANDETISLVLFKKMEINNIFRNEIAKIIAYCNQNSKQLVMSLRSSSEHCFQGTEYQKWWKYISYISTFRIIANLMEKEVEATLDRQWLSNVKKQMKRVTEPFGHDFEAVVTFKQ